MSKSKEITRAYAGATCRKCFKGLNHEVKIPVDEEIKKRQEKRYGGRLCNSCISSYVS